MFLINFNQLKCACVGINNCVILLRARYKYSHQNCVVFFLNSCAGRFGGD